MEIIPTPLEMMVAIMNNLTSLTTMREEFKQYHPEKRNESCYTLGYSD
jgi:hypothetical protein